MCLISSLVILLCLMHKDSSPKITARKRKSFTFFSPLLFCSRLKSRSQLSPVTPSLRSQTVSERRNCRGWVEWETHQQTSKAKRRRKRWSDLASQARRKKENQTRRCLWKSWRLTSCHHGRLGRQLRRLPSSWAYLWYRTTSLVAAYSDSLHWVAANKRLIYVKLWSFCYLMIHKDRTRAVQDSSVATKAIWWNCFPGDGKKENAKPYRKIHV